MKSVLVVDDSPIDRRVAGGLLEQQPGYTVSYAEDGESALTQLALFEPDVILTDLMMPGIDGLELVRRVRKEFSHIPVVLMTSQGSEDTAVQALQAGAAGYVPKKRLAADLLAVIDQVAERVQTDQAQAELKQKLECYEQRFSIENDPRLLKALATHLEREIQGVLPVDEADRTRVRVALEEAFLNAMYHGNLEVRSEEQADEARTDMIHLANRRRSQAPYKSRRIHITAHITPEAATFTIRDEGPGFDHAGALARSHQLAEDEGSRRGLKLMKAFMDAVRFNATGNEVTLVKVPTTGLSGLTLEYDDEPTS